MKPRWRRRSGPYALLVCPNCGAERGFSVQLNDDDTLIVQCPFDTSVALIIDPASAAGVEP